MTANALAGDRECCLAAGMDDYLSKPVQIDKLRGGIERALEHLGLNKAPTAPPPSAVIPAPTGGTAVLDPSALEQLRHLATGEDPHLMGELIDLFLRDGVERLHAIEAAVASRDAAAVRSATHALKGSASNLGAVQVANLCEQITRQARASEFEVMLHQIPALRAALEHAGAALKTVKLQ